MLDAAGSIRPGKVPRNGKTGHLVARRRAFALAFIEIDLVVKKYASEPRRIRSRELDRRLRKALTDPAVDLSALGITSDDPPRATMPDQVREPLIDAIERIGVDPSFGDADAQLDQDIEAIRQDRDVRAITRIRRALTAVVVPSSAGGRPHELPPDLVLKIIEIWLNVLERQVGITVDADGIPSGPLITFTDACLRLAGFDREYGIARVDAIYSQLRRGRKALR